MSAYGTAPVTANVERTAVTPTVKINGGLLPWASCSEINHSAGITPTKAIITIAGNFDLSTNVTLNGVSFGFKNGARCEVREGDILSFVGFLQKRRDVGQGNQVRWEAWDAVRVLLSKIRVRGALVWDKADSTTKFLTRFEARTNPKGAKNCIPVKIAGINGLVPVFSAHAEQTAAYDDRTDDEAMTEGVVGSWTPAKFARYLAAVANLAPGVIAGTNTRNWRYLKSDALAKWDPASCDFVGTAAGSTDSTMHKKMPDQSFRGQTILAALIRTLEIGGTYGLGVTFGESSSGGAKANVSFYVKDSSYATSKIDLFLQRGGDVSNINSVVDFELEEDCSEVAETVIADGAVRKLETTIQATPTFGTNAWTASANDTARPGWDSDEQTAFQLIIKGDGTNAYRVTQIPDKSRGETWCTGSSLNNSAVATDIGAKTSAALALARQYLPRVWKTIIIDSEKLFTTGPLAGVGSAFSDTSTYPYLKVRRPVLAELLQPFVDDNNKITRDHFPIRIQIKKSADDPWQDVKFNSGLEVKADGSIHLHGLTDDISTSDDENIYDGSLVSDPENVTPRHIKITLATVFDHRVEGIADGTSGQIDGSIRDALGGGAVHYVDSPDAWREEHQYSSEVTSATLYPAEDGQGGTSSLTRKLRDDSAAAQGHAQRRLSSQKWQRRMSSWAMSGIRNEFKVGMYIEKVKVSGQSGDVDYVVQAPIEELTFSYMNQMTNIGGLLSEAVSGGTAKAAFAPGAAQTGASGGSSSPAASGSPAFSGGANAGEPQYGKAGAAAPSARAGSAAAGRPNGGRLNKYGGPAGLELDNAQVGAGSYDKGAAGLGGDDLAERGSKTASGNAFEKKGGPLTGKAVYVGGKSFVPADQYESPAESARRTRDQRLTDRTKYEGATAQSSEHGRSLSEQGRGNAFQRWKDYQQQDDTAPRRFARRGKGTYSD